MTNLNDLHIESDILGIFDNTLNAFTKNRLIDILSAPLESVEEINRRQQILKAFLANKKLLERYYYNRLDFHDIQTLLTSSDDTKINLRFKAALFFHNDRRNATKGIYIQLIIFLQQQYTLLSNFDDFSLFPSAYKQELDTLERYFLHFELDFFSNLIREKKFKIHHLIILKKKINALQQTGETEEFFERLFTFESLLSISQSIHKQDFIFPNVGDYVFSINGVYHPLLTNPIRNNITLDKQVALITGSNMAGKSTFLKSIGICVYLGHLGVAIPAEEAEFPFFQDIYVYINHTDDLQRGYSHFINEIKNLKEAVQAASEGSPVFAIFDEIFKGTNMNDALDITRTTVQGLARFSKSMFLISTHMDELKDMEPTSFSSYFLDCKVENGIPAFSYRLNEGWSSVQIGKLLFKNEGLYDMLQKNNG